MVILAVSPALLLILYTASAQSRSDRAEVQARALSAALIAASGYQRYLDSSHQFLLTLAKLQEVAQPDAASCNRLFADLRKAYPLYTNLFAVRPNGDLFCSAIAPTKPINLLNNAWFRQALTMRILVVSEQADLTLAHHPAVILAHPVLDVQGKRKGVVGLVLDPTWVVEPTSGLLPGGWTEVLLDRAGSLLVSYPDEDGGRALPPPATAAFNIILHGSGENFFEGVDRNGDPRLFAVARAFSPHEGAQLTVLISAPLPLAFRVADQALASSLLWLGAVTLLAILGAVVAGDSFVLRQVRALQTAVQHLKLGDLGARVPLTSGSSELQEVAIAFNQMAYIVQQRDAALHHAQAVLEARVEERTATLAQVNEALLREVAERQRREEALQQAQAHLIQAEKMSALGRLAATLAHEINNPLQAVQTHLELLTLAAPLAPAMQAQYIGIAQAEIVRLGRLVENILNFARPARLIRHPVALAELVEQTIVLTRKRLQQANIELVADLPPTPVVLAAPDQLVQVFMNLLLNAIEASSQEHGAIRIAIQHTASMVSIAFANSGAPIPPENMQRIFEPFFTTKPGGTGLGLSISHTLVREHQGELTVENVTGEYAVVFTVTLPLAAPPVNEKEPYL
ncbi:MAG: ATP-binding protein [Caldilineaceae bacterium]